MAFSVLWCSQGGSAERALRWVGVVRGARCLASLGQVWRVPLPCSLVASQPQAASVGGEERLGLCQRSVLCCYTRL
jgi:hypothetical protein